MIILGLILGCIVGLLLAVFIVMLIGDTPTKESLEEIRANLGLSGKAQFYEPISDEEKLKEAKTLKDLIEK